MKKISLLIVAGLTVLVSCNQQATTTKTEETMTPAKEETKAIQVKLAEFATPKDLYCGMDLEEGAIADTTTYQGKLYGFCSTECKQEFVKNPSQYLSQK
jgi:YHS domain-containing protein